MIVNRSSWFSLAGAFTKITGKLTVKTHTACALHVHIYVVGKQMYIARKTVAVLVTIKHICGTQLISHPRCGYGTSCETGHCVIYCVALTSSSYLKGPKHRKSSNALSFVIESLILAYFKDAKQQVARQTQTPNYYSCSHQNLSG